jgi:ribosomal protein S18 acetylase RimI-like enzyme
LGEAMVEIKVIKSITQDDLRGLGRNGYVSEGKYVVKKEETDKRILFRIELESLHEPYVKNWPEDPNDIINYEKLIPHELSLGAYRDEKLLGVLFIEPKKWNKSLWIWNIQVADTHRRMGIGTLLINKLVEKVKDTDFRAIGLETQNTNVPAIAFYYKMGFELDGFDTSYYTNNDLLKDEIAFFMKKRLR